MGKINLVIDGKKVSGQWSKATTVTTNAPNRKVITLTMMGHEIPYLNVSPKGRLFLQGRHGETIERGVTISSNEDDLDLKITKVESNIDDKITYRVEDTGTAGEYRVRVWKNPKLPTQSTYGSLFVYTNSENEPRHTVQLQVITKGEITVQPTVVNYGRIKFETDAADDAVTRQVTLLKSRGEFEITDITFSHEGYTAEIDEAIPGKRYNVSVTFDPPKQSKPRESALGEMVIHTNDPSEPTLKVRLVARSL